MISCISNAGHLIMFLFYVSFFRAIQNEVNYFRSKEEQKKTTKKILKIFSKRFLTFFGIEHLHDDVI